MDNHKFLYGVPVNKFIEICASVTKFGTIWGFKNFDAVGCRMER